MRDAAKELYERATAIMAEERWREAIEIIEAELETLKVDAKLSWNLGWAYFKLDDYATAELHLSHACQLKPGWAVSWWALGVVQHWAGRYADAERNLRRALTLKDGALRRLFLAVNLMKQGRFDEAEHVHLKGLDLKPDSPERWQNYGCFLEDVGRTLEAAEAYRKARRLLGH